MDLIVNILHRNYFDTVTNTEVHARTFLKLRASLSRPLDTKVTRQLEGSKSRVNEFFEELRGAFEDCDENSENNGIYVEFAADSSEEGDIRNDDYLPERRPISVNRRIDTAAMTSKGNENLRKR